MIIINHKNYFYFIYILNFKTKNYKIFPKIKMQIFHIIKKIYFNKSIEKKMKKIIKNLL